MKTANLISQYLKKLLEQSESKQSSKNNMRTEYLQEVSKLTNVESEISKELNQLVSEPCRKDATLWILAAQLHPSDMYMDSLRSLLEDYNECIWHEGIVEIFQAMKDEQVLPSLVIALNHDLKYDPGYAVSVRILETLASIGTSEAVKILEENLKSPNARIREEAQIMLDSLSDD